MKKEGEWQYDDKKAQVKRQTRYSTAHILYTTEGLPLLKVETSGLPKVPQMGFYLDFYLDLLMDPSVGLMRMVKAKLMILFCLVLMMDYGTAQVSKRKQECKQDCRTAMEQDCRKAYLGLQESLLFHFYYSYSSYHFSKVEKI